MGILLSSVNLAESAAANLSASSEAAGLGLRSVLTPQIAEVWRSDTWGATTLSLRVDLGSVQPVRLAAFAAPRDGLLPGSGATVRLRASAVALDGAEALDTGAAGFGQGMADFGLWAWAGAAAPIAARWFWWSFAGTAADAYLQLGRVWIGPALVTRFNGGFGHAVGIADPGGSTRAGISGIRDAQRGAPYRLLTWPAPTLTTAEAEELQRHVLRAGTTGQVFAARNHADAARTGCFGAFTRGAPAPARQAFALWRADFSLDEDL